MARSSVFPERNIIMRKNPLSLSNMTAPEFDINETRKTMEDGERIRQQYRDRYGEDWFQHYVADTTKEDYDSIGKMVNEHIYHGTIPTPRYQPGSKSLILERFWERAETIYGNRNIESAMHEDNDPEIANWLVTDAMRTGKWKELPDGLQNEYHIRMAER